jgi:hypothetical protein
MLEVEAVPQIRIPLVQIGMSIVLCVRSLLLVESSDLRPSNQYILNRNVYRCENFCCILNCLWSPLR